MNSFSTHLTVSRWEPSDESTTTVPASKLIKTPSPVTSSVATFAEEQDEDEEAVVAGAAETKTKIGSKCLTPASEQKQPQQQPQSGNDTSSQAARLMSLANYIRHIITLTSGKSLLHSPSALVQQRLVAMEQQQQQIRQEQLRKLHGWRPSSTETLSSNKESHLPSPLSAGPGPIKPSSSFSTRRHRHASEYHDHQLRRQLHHGQSFQQREQNPFCLSQLETEGHPMPSPISPLASLGGKQTKQNQTTLPFPPLLSIPFPNLTLTLALIYVDRLKAKYPEAKGEPGCSHRLFLVAYIIAAKYRCIVELAALMKQSDHVSSADQDTDEIHDATPASSGDIPSKPLEEQLSEARSRAELIFSNHEWVRLLSLGSFFRPLNSVVSGGGAVTSTTARDTDASKDSTTTTTLPTQPIDRSPCDDDALSVLQKPEPKSLLIQAVPSPGDTKNEVKVGEGVTTPSPAPMQATILQVEDLDRMEAEFLTFLSFDLSTRGQDIDTCWNLLVGNLGV
ncbi:hypothetical protein EC968_000389 [Mortierella alpina]|nr:hypothetical protein EC968_000389 [Mortierella alpina]